jgi:hypothetical protein
VRDLEQLRADLRRWADAGLISGEQARAIEVAEAADEAEAAPAPADARGRIPLVVEALGYVGGVLAVVAGFFAAHELWPDMPRSAQEVFAAAGWLVLLAGGAALRPTTDPAFGRLRGVLWTGSAASLVALCGLFGEGHSDDDVGLVLVVALIAAAYLVVLQYWHPSMLPLAGLFVALAVASGAVADLAGYDDTWQIGLAVWLWALVWIAVVGRLRPLQPREVGYVWGVAGALFAVQLLMERDLGHVFALATVGAVLAAGVVLERTWLLALGTLGLLVTAPRSATEFLPDSVGAPIAVFVVGAGLIAAAVWLARRPGRKRPAGG